MAPNDSPTPERRAALQAFVRATYGFAGTRRLHRAALGRDLVRAPLNVFLAVPALLARFAALGARLAGKRQAAEWLAARRFGLRTDVSRAIEARLRTFLADQNVIGSATGTDAATDAAIEDYLAVRTAVAEITTTALLLITGVLLLGAATPGLFSLIGPVADAGARGAAIDRFLLGPWLGSVYYDIFPVALPGWRLALTAGGLAVVISVVTTFAGMLADPLQVATGTHRRRLARLIRRIEARDTTPGVAGEQLAARMGDLGDLALNLWRLIRG
ncbi:DUF6635 family protein [Maritimibacter sp. UBA3975]|uniref:DUF6635 family protein n=1 Tax=Maritimibacter sp. UBA3975 TaxID=1946833 RepID=UPI000C0A11CD|nr:DUF6635 family protein [Maritimibacter sp. UBA3975]MAM61110.1 hypothetical protein [Maritimibacter sp.]